MKNFRNKYPHGSALLTLLLLLPLHILPVRAPERPRPLKLHLGESPFLHPLQTVTHQHLDRVVRSDLLHVGGNFLLLCFWFRGTPLADTFFVRELPPVLVESRSPLLYPGEGKVPVFVADSWRHSMEDASCALLWRHKHSYVMQVSEAGEKKKRNSVSDIHQGWSKTNYFLVRIKNNNNLFWVSDIN